MNLKKLSERREPRGVPGSWELQLPRAARQSWCSWIPGQGNPACSFPPLGIPQEQPFQHSLAGALQAGYLWPSLALLLTHACPVTRQGHLASSPPEKIISPLRATPWPQYTTQCEWGKHLIGEGVPCIWIGQWTWSFQIAWAEQSCQYENKIELIINLLRPEIGETRCWHPANEKMVNPVAVWHCLSCGTDRATIWMNGAGKRMWLNPWGWVLRRLKVEPFDFWLMAASCHFHEHRHWCQAKK